MSGGPDIVIYCIQLVLDIHSPYVKAVLEMVCVAGSFIVLLKIGICSLVTGQVFKNIIKMSASFWYEFMVSEKKWAQPYNLICTHDSQHMNR
jgi:hypothetical protein